MKFSFVISSHSFLHHTKVPLAGSHTPFPDEKPSPVGRLRDGDRDDE